MEQIALGASLAGHSAEATDEGWLCALFISVWCPVCTCISLQVSQYIWMAVFVWVPIAIRAQPCRPGLRMKISGRFEWVQSFSYANRMH